MCVVIATLRALLCLPGTRGGGSVSSGSQEKQEDQEAEVVGVRTRAQTRAQTSNFKASELHMELQVAFPVNMQCKGCFEVQNITCLNLLI